jgi:hypothetical protein
MQTRRKLLARISILLAIAVTSESCAGLPAHRGTDDPNVREVYYGRPPDGDAEWAGREFEMYDPQTQRWWPASPIVEPQPGVPDAGLRPSTSSEPRWVFTEDGERQRDAYQRRQEQGGNGGY